MTPPKQLTCLSDQNELEYTQTIKTKTELLHEYTYTKSFTKQGKTVTFSESVLEKFLKNKILYANK